MGFGFFDFGFLPIIVSIIFIAVFGLFAFLIIRGIVTWSKNNNSPKISANARIVAKRAHVFGGMNNTSASTSYYATFEFDTGDRLELQIYNNEFGLLAEGDKGVLIFQGTRFLSFQRSGIE